ncbi:MAG: peptide chain release factor 1 [Acidobacteriota bacterium]
METSLLLTKLKELQDKYESLAAELGRPDVVTNIERYRKLAQAHADLQPIIEKFREFEKLLADLENTRRLLHEEKDPELQKLAREELDFLEERREAAEHELHRLLLPKDPNDERNVILEVRAGTGGDEATLFAQEILRMYTRYAERRNWKTELLSATYSDVGGIKEGILSISGDKVYSRLRYESGVHRVQRVPVTEAQGRIHTSAVTVAVLPEADEVEIKIDPSDLRIDTFCSSGPGGQSVNTTYSAVRITHIPTGEVVTCQDEKSQIKNKAKALKVLRSRLYEKAVRERHEAIASSRRSMVKSGDRSEKIRTYNFPQNRVTDHRINLTLYQLDSFMDGDLDEMIEALITYFQAEALQAELAG